MKTTTCYKCGKSLSLETGAIIGRSEECQHCSTDVRVCKNCKHYNEKAYNGCNEPQSERVVDKERRNFCDYFYLVGGTSTSQKEDSQDDVKAKLDALFKS
jgi:hypothetical protein